MKTKLCSLVFAALSLCASSSDWTAVEYKYWTNTLVPWLHTTQIYAYQLPAKPIDGSIIISEERTLQPCFAATLPPCPGHWITNHIRWRMERGEWNRIWETNVWVIPPGSNTNTLATNATVMDLSNYTNLVSSNFIQWNFAGATNVVFELEPLTSLQRSNEVLRLEIGALMDAVQLWKNKYQSERYKNLTRE